MALLAKFSDAMSSMDVNCVVCGHGVAARVSADRVDGAMAAEMDKNDWKQLGCSGLQSARVVSALKKFARQERAR